MATSDGLVQEWFLVSDHVLNWWQLLPSTSCWLAIHLWINKVARVAYMGGAAYKSKMFLNYRLGKLPDSNNLNYFNLAIESFYNSGILCCCCCWYYYYFWRLMTFTYMPAWSSQQWFSLLQYRWRLCQKTVRKKTRKTESGTRRTLTKSIMPAGVSWGRYLTFLVASLASALAGSQVVHLYYKPSLVSS